MKKLLLLSLLPFCLASCASNAETKAKSHIIDTRWSFTETSYIPHYSYDLSIYKDSYELVYHKDAIHTSDVNEEAEDKGTNGKWEYLTSISKSWVGDWNARHSVTYHIVKIETNPYDNKSAYLCYELDSNVMYMESEQPNSVDDMTYYIKLVLKD